jgi:hypothetical protein
VNVLSPPVHHDHRARWVEDESRRLLPRQRAVVSAPAGRPLLHGSFACPWSYLASQRTARIGDPRLRPTWRMSDPDGAPGTRLAAPGPRLEAAGLELAVAELEAVRAHLLPGEHLPGRPPGFVPHTGPAVVGLAEAVGAGVGLPVRVLLFEAYWMDGADIGQPEVLRRLIGGALRTGDSPVRSVQAHGYAVTLTGGPVSSDAHSRLRRWHAAGERSGAAPLAMTAGDVTTRNAATLSALAALAAAASAPSPAQARGSVSPS